MISKILENFKIASLNPMQLASLEASKTLDDLILLSPTGSGKTLAFLLPVFQSIQPKKEGVQVLILVPSRELALQIEQVWRQMGTGFKVNCCYGGHDQKVEKNNLIEPPALLIGTPGRISAHLRKGNFSPDAIHTLVLDEFDKSLESGFQDEMDTIIGQLPGLEKRILTSATNLTEIPDFTGIRKPKTINFLEGTPISTSELQFKYIRAKGTDKLQLLLELICHLNNKPSLVFCNHRDAVERISALLHEEGLSHGIFHGGMDQEDRERELIKFRNGSHRMLITTDLASRGLDIPEIESVIHYQLPATLEVFTHRNGRTARMNAHGTAWLVLAAEDFMPPFITNLPELVNLPEDYTLPEKAPWQTLYFSAGKKDKINKMDIVGLLHQKGKLSREELGIVEVLDFSSFAAVKREKIQSVLTAIREEKLKGKKVKVAVAR
jgi:ATP-independent RNA helicase DbpA